MVGTGANRMPLTKVHPIMLGKQRSSGPSLLAHHRQQHQERRQQRENEKSDESNPSWNQGGGAAAPQRPPLPTGPPQSAYPAAGPPPNMPPPGMPRAGMPPVAYPSTQYPVGMPPPQYNPHMPPPAWNTAVPPPPPAQAQPAAPMPPMMSGGYPAPPQQPPPSMPPQTENPPLPPKEDVKKKRKRSRWGAVEEKSVVPGMPATLPSNMTEDQRKAYLLHFKIEEITQKLRSGDLGIPADPMARSPSPEPIYNSEGKRLNTREFRVRKKLEEERSTLIKQAIEEIPSYKPPADYKPPSVRIQDKVFIPQDKNPSINFIGLLIGPRGNTLKKMEKETSCKIIIRGKGSVKEGKVGRIAGQPMPGEDEPLHAMVTGPTEKDVKHAVEVINKIVKEGLECPDAANELRRNQLRELAALNGTLIEEDIIKCKNCGALDHRHWECTENKNVTTQISCSKCGGYGHVAADCMVTQEKGAAPVQQTFAEKAKMDNEYLSLMAELGCEEPASKKMAEVKTDVSSMVPAAASTSYQGGKDPHGQLRGNYNKPREVPKWGPPVDKSKWQVPSHVEPPPPPPPEPSGPGTQSLMDVKFNAGGPAPRNQGPPPPWMNQGPRNAGPPQRHGGPPPPRQGGPPPPWQQNQQRGPPPGMGGPPRGPPGFQQNGPPRGPPNNMQYPSQQWGAPPPWQQQQQQQPRQGPPSTAYPPPWNQQMNQQNQPYPNSAMPPWAQQVPPPPPPS